MKERKTFTFDGENSADYGLYISGDSVYNAPNREIDMISIPGRNGQLAIDMGRYENITVTYPAFVFADTQEEFREKIRRIRNWLCSKTSYQRLTDEYNPESFRLGLYKSGLEVEPIFYNRCGEFEMSFDCKPQRFLFTGEEVFTLGEWGETETYSGSIVSFEGTETTAIKTLNANIVPKQSGSGDPSPSNVRPISGTDTVNVFVSGINAFDEVMELGTIGASSGTNSSASDRLRTKNYIAVRSGVQYYSTIATRLLFYDANKTYMGLDKSVSLDRASAFTVPNDACYMRFGLGSSYGTTYNNDMSINYPSTDHEYHSYQGTSYPISLGQTVYGGVLDVVSGKLNITRGIYRRTIQASEGTVLGNYKRINLNRVFNCDDATRTQAISNIAKYVASYNNDTSHFYIEGKASGATLNNLLMFVPADGNVYDIEVLYPLATPTEIQLTPTQVKTLLGNNNIFADSGDVTVEIGENPYILVNPTKFEATPIFEVEGSGTLSVGDTTLTINNEGTTIIDTEMMEAYEDDNGAIISRNDDVEGGFPTLTSGINNVEADGLTSVKVTPKWWEL